MLAPDNELVAVCIANALTLMNDKEQAYAYYEKALSMTEDKYRIYICYAISLSEFGEIEKAIEYYNKAIELEPKLDNVIIYEV